MGNVKFFCNILSYAETPVIQDWENLDNFLQNAETIRERRSANVETLEKEVIIPMVTYREQFAEVKRRIDKCEVKRMQMDRNSFQLQQLETSSSGGGSTEARGEHLEAAQASKREHACFEATPQHSSRLDRVARGRRQHGDARRTPRNSYSL